LGGGTVAMCPLRERKGPVGDRSWGGNCIYASGWSDEGPLEEKLNSLKHDKGWGKQRISVPEF